MQRLAELATPAGWKTTQGSDPGSDAPFTDITAGSAGIVLAAVWAGGEYAGAIATTGGEALVAAADETPAGLDWGCCPVRHPEGRTIHMARPASRPRWP
jgi:hypothetical protein